jgi:hypothetical protein
MLTTVSVLFILASLAATRMAVRAINSASGTAGLRPASPTSVDIVHDTADHLLKYKDDAGTVQVIGTRAVPGTLTAPVITSPTITGVVQEFAAAGAAGGSTEAEKVLALVNNTVTDFFTVTVPNAIVGGMVQILVGSMLGDGDSTDSAIYTVAISRVTGAAAKAVMSAKSVVGATAGVTANAVITGSVSAMTGAVGAVNTFTIQFKNARSAGAADNHPSAAIARLVNLTAAGVTIAAV